MEERAQLGILWGKIREAAKKIINPISYSAFVENLTPVDIVNRKIVLRADTELPAKVLMGNLCEMMRKAVASAEVDLIDFIVVVEGSDTYKMEEEPDAYIETPVLLDKRYTFESFVVGSSNKFVYAAAKSVAENPGENFNPLYIYGGSGLGKTHLLQAIANEIAIRKPSMKVLYTSSEAFLNEYIDSMVLKKGAANREAEARFRNHYRNVDVLLIDDIQSWKSTGVQEAFFHTFNELFAQHKQIVISSDRPPKDLPVLEERLRTRFEGGLIADIQPPDIETKIAILKRKALEKKYVLPDDVLEFLVKNSDSNVRTLEGRLNSVIFASKLHEEPISLKLAALALQESIANAPEQKEITPADIIGATCNYFAVSKEDLLSKKRRQDIAHARQICAYLMCDMLALPLTSIGNEMNLDHTTVIYSRNKINELITVNDTVHKEVNDIKSSVLKK